MKHTRFSLIIGIAAIFFSSCQSQSIAGNSPTKVPTSAEQPMISATNTITPFPLQVSTEEQVSLIVSPEHCNSSNGPIPLLSNPEITSSTRPVNNSLGGGVVQSKEFTIELLIYCDDVFQPALTQTYQPYISDIGGLAIYYNWQYDAPYDSGRIDVYYGIESDIRWQSGEGPTASQGHVSQGQSTGIIFAPNTSFDFTNPTPLRFVYVMQTESGQLSGAVLSFELQQISDGLQPTAILVKPLTDIELLAIKDVLPTAVPPVGGSPE
ncbi:MAG: hypothetical protein AB2L18_10005 [Anaerolineaceae bacterium]